MNTKEEDLIYDFNVGSRLEIFVNGEWLQVSAYIFRSFAGRRRIDNVAYLGITYYLNSNDVFRNGRRVKTR